ncbi:MAG: hypothetical protein KBG20_02735 [Caldilineaceae bacterium]|nr:hypothetical protein [Caldilineaceae bacterium]MBP8107342.1 hypothetical protein [Caldilineaceae bacterium]MBP8122618.1 hypothetical protein [Caldilineaceae bacterium]MBP9071180.1 hypothetical protein [Caldilineaceae bacterium]
MKRSVIFRVGLGGLLCALVMVAVLAASAQRGSLTVLAMPVAAPTPAPGTVDAPTISFIDSPSPTCYLPTPETGACYIQWNYMYVTATAGSSIVSMTLAIDTQLRAYHTGFFQTSMYIPGEMTDPGYRVTCGVPPDDTSTGMGNTYTYVIRALDSSGLSTANYGSVTCPADTVHIYLPNLRR